MKQIIECVPNISEGRDLQKIQTIANEVTTVEGVKLLNIDPGKATNRTVITFVGEPNQVVEAAFRLIKKAAELIDMSKHKGEHPRMGATDVCPMIPISGITMEECVTYAHKLGKRVGEELHIPGYYYEYACTEEKRRNLASCREGEYEGLSKKLVDPSWKPDFGPAAFEGAVKTGATAISARDFLIAYNVNLNTTSTRRANAVAYDVREKGRPMREGNPITGKQVVDAAGEPVWIPGACKGVKGIGWFIDEYGIAQVSYNITNMHVAPLHIVFEETCKSADARGLRVTGSELVGLVPKAALLEAGKYFLTKQERSVGVHESELIKIAIKSMGLDELSPFKPEERIIEYMLENENQKRLVSMNLVDFANETASESPAPGGGSISAYVGALGVSLGTMVANLSSHKRGWDERWEEFSEWAAKGQAYKEQLLAMVDEDTNAFNKIMDAFGLANKTEEEKAVRKQAIQDATKYAIEIPFKVMQLSHDSLQVIAAMAKIGNPNSITDAGVGVLCAVTAIKGAFMNVRINASGYNDKYYVEAKINAGKTLLEAALAIEKDVMDLIDSKI